MNWSDKGETGRVERVRRILARDFAPSRLDIRDESSAHRGHAGAGGGEETHLAVTIRSRLFAGLGRLERHRRVMTALEAEFRSGLHALSIDADAGPD